MKKLIDILTIIWLLLVVTGNSQNLKAEKILTATAKSIFVPDVCGSASDKSVLITVGLGNIEEKDSLYGYDFEARFDNKKLKFSFPVFENTLSVFFDKKDITFDQDSGTANGYATTFNFTRPPAYGNLELFGMLGEYIGQCPDTTYVTISYIEFTEEFKPKIGDYKKAVVLPIIADKAERAIAIESKLHSYEIAYRQNDYIDLKLNLNSGSRAKSADIDIEFEKNGLVIVDSVMMLGNSVSIDKVELQEKGIKIGLGLKADGIHEDILRLRVRPIKNVDSSLNIKIVPRLDNKCLCITRFISDSIKMDIKYKDTSGVGVKEEFNTKAGVYYDEANEAAVIMDYGSQWNEGQLYDMRGNIIKKITWNDIDIKKSIMMDGLPAGAYIIVLKSKLNINRSLLIKYL